MQLPLYQATHFQDSRKEFEDKDAERREIDIGWDHSSSLRCLERRLKFKPVGRKIRAYKSALKAIIRGLKTKTDQIGHQYVEIISLIIRSLE